MWYGIKANNCQAVILKIVLSQCNTLNSGHWNNYCPNFIIASTFFRLPVVYYKIANNRNIILEQR